MNHLQIVCRVKITSDLHFLFGFFIKLAHVLLYNILNFGKDNCNLAFAFTNSSKYSSDM